MPRLICMTWLDWVGLLSVIAHNTIIDCKVSMEFGVGFNKKVTVVPSDCIVSHNAFLPGKWELFRVQNEPANFTWVGNRCQSGETRGAKLVEIERVSIELDRGADGLLRPTNTTGLETGKQSDIETDIDGEPRRPGLAGCDDPSTSVTVRKLATSTGPRWRR